MSGVKSRMIGSWPRASALDSTLDAADQGTVKGPVAGGLLTPRRLGPGVKCMLSVASILKKTAMAVTGLIWVLFLIGHLVGNFKLFEGAKKFNAYAEFLESTGPLLIVAEIGLVVFLVAHIYSGISVSLQNRSARPRDYEVKTTNGKATAFSRSMLVGGVILAIFIVTHVATFKFGDHHGDDGLYGLVRAYFANPFVVAWYVLAMFAVGMHLSHGFASAFQTLGVGQPIWRERLRTGGIVLGWLIAGGFISLPIWSYVTA